MLLLGLLPGANRHMPLQGHQPLRRAQHHYAPTLDAGTLVAAAAAPLPPVEGVCGVEMLPSRLPLLPCCGRPPPPPPPLSPWPPPPPIFRPPVEWLGCCFIAPSAPWAPSERVCWFGSWPVEELWASARALLATPSRCLTRVNDNGVKAGRGIRFADGSLQRQRDLGGT